MVTAGYFLFGDKPNNKQLLDSDNDGLSDSMEIEIGTDPNKWDTDGDTFSDRMEYYNIFPDDFQKDCFEKEDGKIICTL